MGDLQLCVSEDRAQALETSSCPNFSQLFPSGLSHPKATLRNGTFIHLSPPPEAPRPWHSALGLKKTKGPRKPGRSIYGTDVQFHCGFAASQHSDRQVDVYRSASGKAISPERHAAVDTTSVTANGLTVTILYVSFMGEFGLIARNRLMYPQAIRGSALIFVSLKISRWRQTYPLTQTFQQSTISRHLKSAGKVNAT